MRNVASLVWVLMAAILSGPSFAKAITEHRISFELIDNRVFIDVYLNGSGPFKMILDSNSSSLTVSPEIARKLNLPLMNPTPCGGAGIGQQTCYDTHLDSATVSGMQTRVDDAAVVPTAAISQVIGFQRLDGVLGVHFFEEHVLLFNYRSNQLTIYSSASDFSSAGRIIPLVPDREHPEFLAVKASADGKPGIFAIDTGDRSDLTVFKLFADTSHIRDSYSHFITSITGQGVNGPIHADVLRLNQFEFDGAQFALFPARFPPPQDFSSKKMSGSIGNGLLKAFNFYFDYPHQRLILIDRNGEAYKNYDRSGLWLTYSRHGFIIGDVVVGSPAATLGLKVGDIVVAVNGKWTSKMGLPSFREKLSDPKVKSVQIAVQRGHKTKIYLLGLADLI
jgi:hypothetical protein